MGLGLPFSIAESRILKIFTRTRNTLELIIRADDGLT